MSVLARSSDDLKDVCVGRGCMETCWCYGVFGRYMRR